MVVSLTHGSCLYHPLPASPLETPTTHDPRTSSFAPSFFQCLKTTLGYRVLSIPDSEEGLEHTAPACLELAQPGADTGHLDGDI